MTNPKYPSGTGATAAVLGHPLHPMLVVIPVAALVGAAVTDWIFFGVGGEFWALTSYWLLLVGLLVAIPAAITGALDFMSVARARTMGIAWAHAIGNIVAIMLVLVNFLIRRDNPADPPIQAILLSSVVFATLLVTAWLGGEMTFRHGIGVSRGVGAHSENENPDLTLAGRPDVGKS
jgi:uncharacterized membrane protein